VRHTDMKWGIGLVLAAMCGATPAFAQSSMGATAPKPPEMAPVAAPASVAAAPATPSQPVWTPPSDSGLGGEGNLHDAPLFEPSGQPRHFTFTYNPATLFLVRAEASFEVMLADHHVLQLTGFYGSTTTNSDSFNNVFRGGGGELGYRWYSGTGGPRGLYIAPSFLAAGYVAIPQRGAQVPYANFGGAIDVGYQAIFADRWVLGLGGGLQYTVPTVTFPAQELPASVYSIRGLRPRLLLALGVAFD
jgi:Protein of unknown function (DUF3575)